MCDTGQQVTKSVLVDHKFQRLGLRASAFLNSNNEGVVYTPFCAGQTQTCTFLYTVLYVIVLHVLFLFYFF